MGIIKEGSCRKRRRWGGCCKNKKSLEIEKEGVSRGFKVGLGG
jgi:hypothetical protein